MAFLGGGVSKQPSKVRHCPLASSVFNRRGTVNPAIPSAATKLYRATSSPPESVRFLKGHRSLKAASLAILEQLLGANSAIVETDNVRGWDSDYKWLSFSVQNYADYSRCSNAAKHAVAGWSIRCLIVYLAAAPCVQA